MMGWLLSAFPRKWLQDALIWQWRRSLTYGDKVRFDYWGATGNKKHHPYQWADKI